MDNTFVNGGGIWFAVPLMPPLCRRWFGAGTIRHGFDGAVQDAERIHVQKLPRAGAGVQNPEEVHLGDDGQHRSAVKQLALTPGFDAITGGKFRALQDQPFLEHHESAPAINLLRPVQTSVSGQGCGGVPHDMAAGCQRVATCR